MGQSVHRVLDSVSRLVLNHHAPEELVIQSTMVTLCGLSKAFAGKHSSQIKTLAPMLPFDMEKNSAFGKIFARKYIHCQKSEIVQPQQKGGKGWITTTLERSIISWWIYVFIDSWQYS